MVSGDCDPSMNSFTCTLGEAAAINTQNSSLERLATIDEFLSHHARQNPELPTAAFPVPSREKVWSYEIFSKF
jgi:hypothetical protein